jgi:predicted ATPase
MESLRITNLKCLKDTNFMDIKPITVLLGGNGTGKSTIVRFFPLLRQTVEERARGALLWFGKYVDFGSFHDAKFTGALANDISFSFQFILKGPYFSTEFEDKEQLTEVQLTLSYDEKKRITFVSRITCKILGVQIDISISGNRKVTGYNINGEEIETPGDAFEVWGGSRFVPIVVSKLYISDTRRGRLHSSYRRASKDLFFIRRTRALLKRYFSKRVLDKTIDSFVSSLPLAEHGQFVNSMMTPGEGKHHFIEHIRNLQNDDPIFSKSRNYCIAGLIHEILSHLSEHISALARNTYYIGPSRAIANRHYREQELDVDIIDYQGQNVAMFLRSLTDEELKSFNEWAGKNFGINIIVDCSVSHVSVKIKELGKNESFNIADMGFGFSQILPIIAQAWAISTNRNRRRRVGYNTLFAPTIFAIEQPELHLHPTQQAMVANMLVSTVKTAESIGLDLRLVVETHSEAIINRLGELISGDQIESSAINVLVFDRNPLDGSASVTCASYDANGNLQNWPFGFFVPQDYAN